jgi:hypothetical protein
MAKKHLWPLIAVLIILLLHFFQVFYLAENTPWYDDYIVTFYEIEGILNSEFSNKLSILTGFYADHRSFLSRAFFLTQVKLNNLVVNYRTLILVGSLFSFLFVYVFYLVFKKAKKPALYILPITFLLVNHQYYEAIYFANGVYGYLAIAVLTCVLLYETAFNGRVLVMMLLGTLCLLTFGNGLVSIFCVTLMLLLQRRWKSLLSWAAFSGIAVYLYFIGKTQQTHASRIPELRDWKRVIKTIGAHSGSPFSFEKLINENIVSYIGLVILLYVLIKSLLLLKRAIKTNLESYDSFIFGLVTFSILSILAISILRGVEAPYIYDFSRYKFGPLLLLTTAVMFLFEEKIANPKLITLGLFCFFFIPNLIIYYQVSKEFRGHNTAINWFSKTQTPNFSKEYDPHDFSQKYNIVYKIPDSELLQIKPAGEFASSIQVTVDNQSDFKSIYVDGLDFEFTLNKKKQNYILFKSEKQDFIVPLKVELSTIFRKPKYHLVIINEYQMPGEYQLSLVQVKEDQKIIHKKLKQKIHI